MIEGLRVSICLRLKPCSYGGAENSFDKLHSNKRYEASLPVYNTIITIPKNPATSPLSPRFDFKLPTPLPSPPPDDALALLALLPSFSCPAVIVMGKKVKSVELIVPV